MVLFIANSTATASIMSDIFDLQNFGQDSFVPIAIVKNI